MPKKPKGRKGASESPEFKAFEKLTKDLLKVPKSKIAGKKVRPA